MMFRRFALATLPRAAVVAASAASAPVACQSAGFFFPGLLATSLSDLQPRYGPHVQVSEENGKVLVELDVPRYRPADVEVTVDKDRGVITIKGKRVNAQGEVQSHFQRSFSVAPELDLDSVETKVEDGVAYVSVKRLPDEAKANEEEDAPQLKVETADQDASEKSTAADTAKESSMSAERKQVAKSKKDDGSVAPAMKDDSYAAVRKMSWPPEMETKDDAKALVYSCTLPRAVKPDNIDIRLERGYLTLGVRATVDTVRKDSKGNVVYEDSRSVYYSNALPVPPRTTPDDVSVSLKDGRLCISIRRHAEEDSKGIKVNEA